MKASNNALLFICALICFAVISSSFKLHTRSTFRQLGSSSTRLSVAWQRITKEATPTTAVTPKSVTNEIITYFSSNSGSVKETAAFQKRLSSEEVKKNIDGLHIITVLFQSARSRKLAKIFLPPKLMLDRLQSWDRQWSERDISMFVYGVRSLEGFDPVEGKLLKFGAKKISESSATLNSRSIGNSLYGLQDITSDTAGAAELCAALAEKVRAFEGDLNGQDIGIGLYGLQGMSADVPQVRQLIDVMADKVSNSISELDAQAMSNALYGLQSMDSDYAEVRRLVGAISVKVSESVIELLAQAIGSSLYGLQKLSSDSLEVSIRLAL
jgi:hypothetical protein